MLPPSGVEIIRSYLKTLPNGPGVYRMINSCKDVLYVGKAKNLKKRVTSYTRLTNQSNRTCRLIMETVGMEFVTTHTEAEALLLEADLIKRYRPRYNILLRDDKSFPSILLTKDHPFSQVLKHRGAQKRSGDYFGPFASVWAVNDTLTTLQKAFLLRSCTDSVFSNRNRPCLLHQIKRCSAPCVDRISLDEYQKSVEHARAFLNGESRRIQLHFSQLMQKASDSEEFEIAAAYRDRIRSLTRIQAKYDTSLKGVKELDAIAVYQAGGQTCIQVFFFRSGASYGNKAYFPSHAREDSLEIVLEAFLVQFYVKAKKPEIIILSHKLSNQKLIAEALSISVGRKVKLSHPKRGAKRKLINHALANAVEALERRMAENATQRSLLVNLAKTLCLSGDLERIEVYDNSHISGTKAVGAMIVAGPDGLIKKAYRKFNIREARAIKDSIKNKGYAPEDDYAMMREVLMRRFSRVSREDPNRTGGKWPDLVIIDGGRGQLSVAFDVLKKLGIEGVDVIAIAKGPNRNSGRERIYLHGRDPITLGSGDPVLYFLQRLRDEAHRFAIGTHRKRRSRALIRSLLDDIPGIGPKRKKSLLHHFGAAKAVAEAGQSDLESVDGINKATAHRIYEWFHEANQ